ncbi:hypothetical protein HDV02_003764 [Globomyces sp. JEL0801]|nr:hypothetical protein HDV02_003764 [Globomyces sp. JEL0801]
MRALYSINLTFHCLIQVFLILSSNASIGVLPKINKESLEELFKSPGYMKVDSWLKEVDFSFQITQLDSDAIVSIQPIVDNIPVLNCHRHLVVNKFGIVEHSKLHFIPKENHLDRRSDIKPFEDVLNSLRSSWVNYHFDDKLIHEITWFPHEDELRKVYHMYNVNPAPHDSHVWIVDGLNGEILASYPRTVNDQGYAFPINESPRMGQKPPKVELLNVGKSPESGLSIRGSDFQSGNTCFAYTSQKNNGNATVDEAICVDPSPSQKEGVDFFTTTSYFAVNGKELDYSFDWVGNSYNRSVVYMQWKNAPVAASRLKRDKVTNEWGSDIDFAKYTGGEYTDSFAELQAYNSFTNHAKLLRELMGNPDFCFLGSGPNCTVLNPATNLSSTENGSPIRFFVNYQALQTEPGPNSKYPHFSTQIKQGLGKNLSYPIIFDGHMDHKDAYFSRAPFYPNVTQDCADQSCVSLEDYPYTKFVFGQSSQFDWGLNPCTVGHELTHALVAQFIPTLPSHRWVSTGLRSDPGALNEGWADYFGAIHCGVSDFTKFYNGHPKRNLNNQRTCRDSVGQVHADSLIFSGGLWEVRNYILNVPNFDKGDQTAFDRIVLKALMMGHATDLFSTQFELILELLKNHDKLSAIYSFANDVFRKRELDCVRMTTFSEQGDPTFNLPGAPITRANLSTIPNQLKFVPRKSDWSATLRWRQWATSGWLGPLDTGYGESQLMFMTAPCEITINGNHSSNVVGLTKCESSQEKIEWQRSTSLNKFGYFSFDVNGNEMYMIIGSDTPVQMTMYSSSLTYYGFNRIWRFTITILGLSMAFLQIILGLKIYFLSKKFGNMIKMSTRLSLIFAIVFAISGNFYNCDLRYFHSAINVLSLLYLYNTKKTYPNSYMGFGSRID